MASDANDEGEGMRGIGYAAASERELSETAAASSSAAGSASGRQLPETADEGTIPVDATVAASSESERQLPETSSEGVIPVDLEDEDVETEDPEVIEVIPTTRRIKHWADATVESDDATASTQQLALPPQPSSADEAEGWQKAGGKKKNKAKQGPNKYADVDRIQQFLLDFTDEVVYFNPRTALIHDSIADFVATLRSESSHQGSHFIWPVGSVAFQNAVAVALHHLPPGHYFTVRNGRDPPPHHYTKGTEWLCDYYHGTTCFALQNGVLRNGLKASLGAGQWDCQRQYGTSVPMVYVSRNFNTACGYPWNDALKTVRVPNHGEISGGELVAGDGTLPLRVLLRCTAVPERKLWSKRDGANSQDGFLPEDVFITHMIFYAVAPNLVAAAQSRCHWELRNLSGATSPDLLRDDVITRLEELEAEAESGSKLTETSATASSSSAATASGSKLTETAVAPQAKSYASVVASGSKLTETAATTGKSAPAAPESGSKLTETSGGKINLRAERLKPHVDDELLQRAGQAFAIPRTSASPYNPQHENKRFLQDRLRNRMTLIVGKWAPTAGVPDGSLDFLGMNDLPQQEQKERGEVIPILELEMLNVHRRLKGPDALQPLLAAVHDQAAPTDTIVNASEYRPFDDTFKKMGGEVLPTKGKGKEQRAPKSPPKAKGKWSPSVAPPMTKKVPEGHVFEPPPPAPPKVPPKTPPAPPKVPPKRKAVDDADSSAASGKASATAKPKPGTGDPDKKQENLVKRRKMKHDTDDAQLRYYTKLYRIAV